ncbi:hypothetical protein [Clostridioides difficile]|nr:hypothetical protein [Clostridioides difficile]EHJ28686.1 hypothetical protein HMPREF1122_02607 [Clostridioides difficile 002-P50-2011]MDY6702236.1 hypothetical protein [Clostridioides difficile]
MPSLFWGFILTKWYVNKVKFITSNSVSSCFILTKWYVNTTAP